MLTDVIIRHADLDDADSIIEFNCALALETEGINLVFDVVSEGVKKLLQDQNLGFYLVAQKNEEIIGCLMITSEWSDWRNSVFWWIQSVYVRPDSRKQDVYRSLYQFVQNIANKNSDVAGFRLYVEKENFKAQNTYVSLGMAETQYLMFEELKASVNYFQYNA
jgi:ribosomal protein S18 acetylase RimI-like enzyme